MKCTKCQNLKFTQLVDPPKPENKQYFFAILHETRNSFNLSKSEGCEFCILISGQLGDGVRLGIVPDEICDQFNAFIVLKCRKDFPTSPRTRGKTVFIRSKLGSAHLYVIEDLLENYQRRGTSNQDDHTGSSENLQLARLWLDNCINIEKHPACKREGNQRSPSRLVNIEDANRPFLEETGTAAEPSRKDMSYVALSYSWGLGGKFQTMRANVEEHLDIRRGIPLDKLSQNFKDAIKVVKELEYNYLWTDALCIVQDCPGDLGKEIPNMGDIYQFADLTLYAERAESAHHGLFETRKAGAYRPVEVELKFEDKEGAVSCKKITLSAQVSGVNFLGERGWIFQEEILSSRLLVFGKQLKWWCKGCVAEETDPVPRVVKYDGKRIGVEKFRKDLLVREDNVERHYFEMWYDMVEEYSKRKLTQDSDTLHALAGLATRFGAVHQGSYLEGLWREDIQYGLGWFTAAADYRVPSRKGKDIAPSWSWASVGKVNISFVTQKAKNKGRKDEDKEPNLRLGLFKGARVLKPQAPTGVDFKQQTDSTKQELHFHGRPEKLIVRRDAELERQKTGHPNYVRPTAASRINWDRSTPASQKRKKPDSHVWLNSRFPALVLGPGSNPVRIGETALDTHQPESEGTTFCALPLFWIEIWGQVLGVCLLLEDVTGDGTRGVTAEAVKPLKYRRVGLAVIDDEKWLEEKEKKEVPWDLEHVVVI